MVMLRRDLIDPHCITPTWIDGIGALEVRNNAIHVTYFVEQEEYATRAKLAVVACRLIYPVSACLPGGILRWAKQQRPPDAALPISDMAH